MSAFRIAAIVVCAAAVAGCAADTGQYPSLARRPAERVTGSADAVTPEPPAAVAVAPPSPELGPRLEGLVAQARAAHQRFLGKQVRARQLTAAASGAAVASESWAIASIALADLESTRSDAMIALADLDQLYAAARIDGADAAATSAARDEVLAFVATEDLVLADLRGRMRT